MLLLWAVMKVQVANVASCCKPLPWPKHNGCLCRRLRRGSKQTLTLARLHLISGTVRQTVCPGIEARILDRNGPKCQRLSTTNWPTCLAPKSGQG